MNSMRTVVVALLSVFAACEAEFHIDDGKLSRNHPRLALPELPTCGGCEIAPGTPLQDLFSILKDFGPTMKKAIGLATTIFNTKITSVKDMQAHVKKVLQDGKDLMSSFFSKVSTASANLTSCPALKTSLDKLKTNLDALIDDYIKYCPTLITAVDTASVMDAYRKTMVNGSPNMLALLSSIIYSAIQVSGSAVCTVIGPVFNVVFDPNGVFLQQISKFLGNGGSAATTYVNLLAGGFLPGGKQGGPLDQFEILKQTVCGLLTTTLVGSDLANVTGGYCPGGSFNPLGELLGIFCAFLDVVDPNGSDESCAAGGGDSGQQSGLGTLLCAILGLLGLCSGGGTNPVQTFTAVVCRVVNALGGVGLPIC